MGGVKLGSTWFASPHLTLRPLFSLSLAMASRRGTSLLAATTSSAYKPISVWSLNAHTIYEEGTRAVEGGSALIPLQQNEQYIDHAHLEHNK